MNGFWSGAVAGQPGVPVLGTVVFTPTSNAVNIGDTPGLVATLSLSGGNGQGAGTWSTNHADYEIQSTNELHRKSTAPYDTAGTINPQVTYTDAASQTASDTIADVVSVPTLSLTTGTGSTEFVIPVGLSPGDTIYMIADADCTVNWGAAADANDAVILGGSTPAVAWPLVVPDPKTNPHVFPLDGTATDFALTGGTWVEFAGSAPTWSVHPSNQSITEPALITLTATPVDYTSVQWQKENSVGADLYTNISGETATTLTNFGPNFNSESGIKYRLAATNAVGTSYSDSATITIALLAPPSGFVAGDLQYESEIFAITLHADDPNPADADVWLASGGATLTIATGLAQGTGSGSYLRGNGYPWPDMAGYEKLTVVAHDAAFQIVARRDDNNNAIAIRVDVNFDVPFVAGANSGNVSITSQTVGTVVEAIYTGGGAASSERVYGNVWPNRNLGDLTPDAGVYIDLIRIYGKPA